MECVGMDWLWGRVDVKFHRVSVCCYLLSAMCNRSHETYVKWYCQNTTHTTYYQHRSILLAIIVEKSKKCLDFSVTLFLLHIIVCSIYGGFPATWDWWIIHILGMIMMVLFGEYFCSKRELSDIPLLVIWDWWVRRKEIWFLLLKLCDRKAYLYEPSSWQY